MRKYERTDQLLCTLRSEENGKFLVNFFEQCFLVENPRVSDLQSLPVRIRKRVSLIRK